MQIKKIGLGLLRQTFQSKGECLLAKREGGKKKREGGKKKRWVLENGGEYCFFKLKTLGLMLTNSWFCLAEICKKIFASGTVLK